VHYLRKFEHDVDRLDDVAELGLGAEDDSIARYAREHDRLILTQDHDFVSEPMIENTEGVLFQRDRTLTTREVGDAINEMAQYLDQSEITLEYVSRNWL
jgi:predicted nuclease of predicted toxin-antitoxin system